VWYYRVRWPGMGDDATSLWQKEVSRMRESDEVSGLRI
jgi:hypothetical protein